VIWRGDNTVQRATLGGLPHRRGPADAFALKAVESFRSCIDIDLHRSNSMTSRKNQIAVRP